MDKRLRRTEELLQYVMEHGNTDREGNRTFLDNLAKFCVILPLPLKIFHFPKVSFWTLNFHKTFKEGSPRPNEN